MSINLKVGQHVRIHGGLFADYEGEILALEGDTATVSVTIFGKKGQAKVTLDELDEQIQAAKWRQYVEEERRRRLE
jgi:transcription antitermination factor NusG